MMQVISLDLQLFRTEADRPRSEAALLYVLEALTLANCDYLQQYKETPALYDAGILYEAELVEHWQGWGSMLRTKRADCEDLAAGRVSELRVRFGVPTARCMLKRKVMQVPPSLAPGGLLWLYHILAWTPTGIEDPSRVLGMGTLAPPLALPQPTLVIGRAGFVGGDFSIPGNRCTGFSIPNIANSGGLY